MKNEFASIIKSDMKMSPTQLMNRYMDEYIDRDYSVDEEYVGVIVDNNDPEKIGRCRIMVYNIFDGLPVSDLPWAVPDFSFIGSTKGSFIVPPVGTFVNVYFDRGEIYLPRYTTKILNTNQLPTNKDIDYPNNMVFFETDNGDSFELNRKQKTATYTHSSGTTIKIASDGSVTIESVANITTKHEDTLRVEGNMVTPTGYGPLCSIPVCPFSGALHTGVACSSIDTYNVGERTPPDYYPYL